MIAAVDDAATSAGTTDDDARWAEAARLAGGSPSPLPTDQVRRRQLRTWVVLGAVLAVAVGVGLLAFALGRGDSGTGRGPDVASWRETVGLVVSGTGLVVMVAGAVVAARAGVWGGWLVTRPESALTRAQVRQLHAQVRGRAPVSPQQLPVARDLAGRLVRLRATSPMGAGLVLLQVGQVIGADSWTVLAFSGAAALGFSVARWSVVRQAAAARDFLDRHPLAPARDGRIGG